MTAWADAEVIVVGAGPAGAATAWALARSGVDVLLLDRAYFPRDKVCGEYLSPQASRLLHEMGALARVEASGAPQLRGMTVRSPNGAEMRGQFAGAHGFRGFRDRGLAVRRRVLDSILVDCARAAGARVREGVRVTDVAGFDVGGRVTGVRVAPINGEPARELTASVVVGADGLRSIVARRLGVAKTSPWLRRLAFVAHYRGVRGPRERHWSATLPISSTPSPAKGSTRLSAVASWRRLTYTTRCGEPRPQPPDGPTLPSQLTTGAAATNLAANGQSSGWSRSRLLSRR